MADEPFKARERFAEMLHDVFRKGADLFACTLADEHPTQIAGWMALAAEIERLYGAAPIAGWMALAAEIERLYGAAPIPMLLWCPGCGERHIDRGTFATKAHHTHACQSCGMVWRPAKVDTVGVQFLPGYKDAPREDDAQDRIARLIGGPIQRCGAWSYPGHVSWDIKLGKPDGRQCALDAGHQGPHELTGPWTALRTTSEHR